MVKLCQLPPTQLYFQVWGTLEWIFNVNLYFCIMLVTSPLAGSRDHSLKNQSLSF